MSRDAELLAALERALKNCGSPAATAGMLNRLRTIAHHGAGRMSPHDGPVVERLVEEQIVAPDKSSGRSHTYRLAGGAALRNLLTQVNVSASGKLYIA